MADYWISDAQNRVLGPVGLEVIRHLVGAGRLRNLTRASVDGRHFAELRTFPEVAALIEEVSTAQRVERDRQEARRLSAQLEALRGKPVHEVFGLAQDASIDAFRASFFALVRRFYPDRLPCEADGELRQAYGAMFSLLSQLMAQIEQRARPVAPPPAARPTYTLYDFVGWERRQDNRVHVDLRITLESVGLLTQQQAVNVSNGGVFLASQKLLPLGEHVQLRLHFEDPARNISARGAVVWLNEAADSRNPRGMGVRFTALEEDDRRFILYYVKKAQLRAR